MASRRWPAHLTTEIHQRLVPGLGAAQVEPRIGGELQLTVRHLVWLHTPIHPRPHPSHVGVDHRDAGSVGEACNGRRRVLAHTGQRPQRLPIAWHHAVMLFDDLIGRAVQRHGAPRVAEPAPRPQHVGARRRCQSSNVGESSHERLEGRNDARRLRLLQHDLTDQHGIRIGTSGALASGGAPRVGPASRPVPGQQGFPRLLPRTRLLTVVNRRIEGARHDRDP